MHIFNSRKFGRIRTMLLAVVVAAVAMLFGFSAPAQAYGTRPASCNTASLCWYNNANFVDGPGKVTSTNNSLAVFAHSSCPNGTWDDCITSIWNATAYCFHLYAGYNTTGGYHSLAPNDGYTNLGTQAAYNDVISSVKRGTTGSCAF